MAENSRIEWTHHSFNPWEGCVNVSAECDHCYAESRDRRMHGHQNWGRDALRLYHTDAYWKQLRKWNRDAEAAGERRRVFEGSLCDVMEDRHDLAEPRGRLFAEVEATPWLDHLMLTKRPQNFRKFLPSSWLSNPRPNVWLGTTVGVEKSLWRVDELRAVAAAVRFLSVEPMLEDIDFIHAGCLRTYNYLSGGIHWVILGGESGPNARPCREEWIRHGVRQCRESGIAPFVKQMGSSWSKNRNIERRFESAALSPFDSRGGDWNQWPEDLRIREFPKSGQEVTTRA